jgi:putative phosphoribosyl transferase
VPCFHAERRSYRNPRDAGAELATHLNQFKDCSDVVVLALPRGGVPVGYEVARALDAPLDVFLVRKLGPPRSSRVGDGRHRVCGIRVLNEDVVSWFRIPETVIERVAREERAELERRERAYREGRSLVELGGRVVVLVDDGLATGSTLKAAVEALRAQGPSRIVVAVPVGSPETCREFAKLADEIVCARAPDRFAAVGQWYVDFSQTSDEEVRDLLEHAGRPAPAGRGA